MASILVIDDDEQVRDVVCQMLKGAGYEVAQASDGKIGVNLYKNVPADLVITDILMPNEDGLEAITELKKDFPDVKIIAMSGGGRVVNSDFLNIASSFGAMKTLKKPFDKEELLSAVESVLAT